MGADRRYFRRWPFGWRASAPEIIVDEIIDAFKARFDVKIELAETTVETENFLYESRNPRCGIDGEGYGIRQWRAPRGRHFQTYAGEVRDMAVYTDINEIELMHSCGITISAR